jgi:membrane protease YdiL (CAAX protease family)
VKRALAVSSRPGLRSTLLIAGIALAISLAARGRELPSFSLLLVGWTVIEGIRGHRAWSRMGFRLDNLRSELRRNAGLVALGAVVMQIIFWLIARFVYPSLMVQVQARTAVMQAWPLPFLLAFIAYETLAEEIALHGFVQGRLVPHTGTVPAILLAALLAGAGHWQVHISPLPALVDVLFVMADASLYGLIYARSGNIWIAWMAHLLADLVSLVLIF